nr:MAG TPA: hypothetical protein [Caudoviricetes sp.]
MNKEKMTASFSIDAQYIEGEVNRIVKAAIVSALGNRDEIIKKAIDNTIDSYVDERGNPCKKDSYRAKPYLDYLAEKTVENVVREAMAEVVDENRETFKTEIKKAIGKRKLKNDMAQSFVQMIIDDAKSEWRMPVTVSIEKPKEY